MTGWIRAVALSLVVLGVPAAGVSQTFNDPGFVSELVTSLSPFTAMGVAWAPDGRMFIWTKNGLVRVFKNGVLLPTPFIDLRSEVNTFDDRGMWGFTFHPDFVNNGYVYLAYVYEEGGDSNDGGSKTSRVVRVQANPSNPDVALAGSPTVILGSIAIPNCSEYPAGSDCIPADGGGHTLGMLRFAPDGKLLVGIGDGSDGDFRSLRAQHLDNWNGKILRVNDDGTAPGDNPFDDGTQSVRSKVWVFGVRNPYRFSVQPGTDTLLVGDVGWNTSEEINKGQPGANFGWPCYEGSLPQSFFSGFSECRTLPAAAVTQPILSYGREVGASVIGGTVYTGETYPETYRGNYFFADYVSGWIRRVVFDSTGQPASFPYFATQVTAPATVEMGPDGNLYYVSFTTGQIRRIRYNGPSAVASVLPNSGYSPLTVSFSSAGSVDPTGGPLTYSWDFGDGATSTDPNPSHTYVTVGVTSYSATLTVRTTMNATSSATVTVTVGSKPPTTTILIPATGTAVRPGQTVLYQGQASDPDDGPLPASALRWTILLHHNTHIHTYLSDIGSTQGSFVVEDHGLGTYSYEIVLEAIDSSGLTGSSSVVLPATADTTPPTAPTVLSATPASSTKINLSWTASTDDGGVIGYHVERCQGAGCTTFAEIVTTAATTFSDGTVDAGTTYGYRVRAVDAAGNLGPYAPIASVTTPAGSPVPTGLLAAYGFDEGAGSTVADASGNGNTGTISGATWTTAGRFGSALSFNGVDNLVTIAGSASLDVGMAMTLEAWIYPTAMQSAWRTILQREAEAYFLNASTDAGPLRPGGGATVNGTVRTVAGPTANPLGSWTHVAMTYNGSTFTLYVNGAAVASQAAAGEVQSTTTALRIGGNLSYGEFFTGIIDEVRVYNRALTPAEIQTDMTTPLEGGGEPSDTTAPTPPGSVTATAATSTQVDLSWTAATDNVGVTGYRVERCTGAGCAAFAEIATSTGLTYSDGGRAESTTYRYQVRAEDAAGNLGAYSALATVTTPAAPDTTAPMAPGGLTATAATSTQVDLSWSAASDNVGVTGYRVERCTGAGCTAFAEIAPPTGLSYSDGGRTAGTTYRYQVRAVDAAGNVGPYSAIATVTTPDTTAIALETVSSSLDQTNVRSVSWSHTSGGSNRVLVVGAVSRHANDGNRPVVSVTYGGINLTLVRQDDEPVNDVYSSLWCLVNAPTGSHTVIVTYAGTVTEASGIAASFSGVDQASPVAANAGYTQPGGMTASASLPTIAANAWLVDIQYAGADDSVSLTSGQTALINAAIAAGRTTDRVVMTTKGPISPAAPTAMSYSYSESSQVALSVVALRPASGPTITLHPTSQTVPTGVSVTFSVRASGPPPLRYQWQRNGIDIPGATAPDYTIASVVPADSGARLRATVSSDFDTNGVLSNEATLTVIPNEEPTIALETVSSSVDQTNVSSVSWSHTTSGSNRVLVVGAVSRHTADANRPVVRVTYGGINLTLIRQDDEPVNDVYSSLWYLVNAPTGPHPVTITYAGTVTEASGVAASFSGVDQASPIAANAGYTQPGGMIASASLPAVAANVWLVDIQYAGADDSVSLTSGQTALVNTSIATGRTTDRLVMTTKGPISPAATTGMSYSYSESSQVALSIIALRPAAAFDAPAP